MLKTLALALLCSFACQADTALDTVYTWTFGDISYTFTTTPLAGPVAYLSSNSSLTIDPSSDHYGFEATTLCSAIEEQGCVGGIVLASWPNLISDRMPTEGQAGVSQCIDFSYEGGFCNGFSASTVEASFPMLNLAQYGVYQGTMIGPNTPTTLTIEPAPEPATGAFLTLSAALAFLAAMIRRRGDSKLRLRVATDHL